MTSGGATGFSTFNSQTVVGSTTLTTAQIPGHTHGVTDPGHNHTYQTPTAQAPQSGSSTPCYFSSPSTLTTSTAVTNISIQSTGGGGSHNHSITTNIFYRDFIIAVKN